MIIDSSAAVAIVRREPASEACMTSLHLASVRRMSAANVLETSVVLSRVNGDVFSALFDELLAVLTIIIEPVTADQARIARAAHRRYGRGSRHRAHLNFGDCIAYALARVYDEPLLFVGDDFIHTDLRSALSPG